MASGGDSREKKTADMAYTTEKFFADIDAKNYINEFRRTDYFIEFCQQCKNYGRRYGCPPFDDETLSIVEGYEKVRIMGVKIIPNNKQLPLSAANDLKCINMIFNHIVSTMKDCKNGIEDNKNPN